MKRIIKKIINNLGYILLIAAMIVGAKVSTNATWINVIKSEFWNIIFVLIVIIIAEIVLRILKDE